MNKKDDITMRDYHSFNWIYTEFREALAVLEPLGKKNVVLRNGPNKLWMGRYLFVNKPRSDGTCLLSDYEQFFVLRRDGSEMVNNARKEIKEDLSKIVKFAKDIKRYSDDSLKEWEIENHNAEILIRLQDVITPYLVARKLSE